MRKRRDQLYGNIYPEEPGHERWVGDLGEMTFKSWLNSRGVPFKWLLGDAAGNADFVVDSSTSVGIKTVKRVVKPQAGYTMQVTAKHAGEPVDHFFFLSYEYTDQTRVMWLLGGVERQHFLSNAKFYRAGEWIHPRYQVKNHDIYNTDVRHFIPPGDWLKVVTGK